VTSRELIAWQARHARRARAWWAHPLAIAALAGGALAAWVGTRGGDAAAAHAWLAGALAVFAVAYLRVPFHIYWRADGGFLAQLPIGGAALYDAAAWRCASAAAWATLAVLVGAVPLALRSDGGGELFARAAGAAGALGAAAAGLVPAVATWGATLVATSDGRGSSMRFAAALATASPTGAARAATSSQPPAPSALLGALPGVAAVGVFVLVLLETRWLAGGAAWHSPPLELGGLAAASAVAALAARALAPAHMGTVLRDVSALDRQRLAVLEIRPPTAIERGVARLVGAAAALTYLKDARLVRRRYPMAFALGALAFLVLVVVGLARPADPAPWLALALGGATVYAGVLALRLGRPPIELPRLTATLPLAPAAIARAKLAWVAAWWLIFVGAPAAFALARVA
jgi:hypothetical protein